MARKSNTTTWLMSWDEDGLEALVNVTDMENKSVSEDERVVWETLKASKGEEVQSNTVKSEMNRIFQSILLRAQFNAQRHYEVYSVGIDAGISEDSIQHMFKENPQGIVDLVRARGTQHYSNRRNTKVAIV